MSVADAGKNALIVRGGWDGHQPVEATDLLVPFLEESGYTVEIRDSPPSTPTRTPCARSTSSCSATR